MEEDVCSDPWSGSGCQGHDGHCREVLSQLTQLLVVRAEVVTPLTDAVSLIDHKPGQLLSAMQGSQSGDQFVAGTKLCRKERFFSEYYDYLD